MMCSRCESEVDLTFWKMQEAFFINEILCQKCFDLEVDNYGLDED